MCGFFALSSQTYIPDLGTKLKDVCRSLNHRGPDSYDFYHNNTGTLGLAHTRLSIQDTSSLGNQPMFNANKTISIVFNGEIYNVASLRSQLLSLGYIFHGTSDTEVLLNLYLAYGIEFLDKLN